MTWPLTLALLRLQLHKPVCLDDERKKQTPKSNGSTQTHTTHRKSSTAAGRHEKQQGQETDSPFDMALNKKDSKHREV